MNPFDIAITMFSGGTCISTIIFIIRVWPILRRIGTVLDQHDLMWNEFAQRHGLVRSKGSNGGVTYGQPAN